MKITQLFVLSSLLFVFLSCDNTKKQEANLQKTEKASTSTSKTLDAEYTGILTEQDLMSSNYTNRWFTPRKEQYVPHKPSIKIIEKHINDYDIEVFMGTWCPDSHNEIPRLFSILDEVNYDQDKLTVYTLDRNKQSAENVEKGKDIFNVPTIIFYKNGKEINRFVESPRESLARDMAKIVSGKEYKNIYE